MNQKLDWCVVPINVPERQGVFTVGINGVDAEEPQSDGAESNTLPMLVGGRA